MKSKMNILLFSITGVVILLLLLFIPFTLKGQVLEPKINHYVEYSDPIEYARNGPYGWEAAYNKGYAEDILNYRKEVAPLSPDRFIRRIKMLFGVDITGHTDDKGHFYFSELVAIFPESQLVRIQQELSVEGVPYTENMVYIPEKRTYVIKSHDYDMCYLDIENNIDPHPRELSFSDILLYCKWIYYSDMEAYGKLRKSDLSAPRYEETEDWGKVNQITNKHLGAAKFDARDRDADNEYYVSSPNDNLYDDYNQPLLKDVMFIQALNTAGRDRVINNISETTRYDLDFDPVPDVLQGFFGEEEYDQLHRPFALCYRPSADEYNFVTKPRVDSLRYDPYIMGLLRMKTYLMVPNYVRIMGSSIRDFLLEHRAEFEKYDYFGYTLFRQMAKTGEVDNRQVGVPHTATSLGTASLRLDPHNSSIVFDSLQSGELFTVYDMGYDDYYLAQCAKPVEEWGKRDVNGYAMCTGRLERVWGYVRKKEVMLRPGGNPSGIRPFIDWGIVSDADGYVNLRDKSDPSRIVGKIPSGKWVKLISYDMKNYLVETQDGMQGHIHKSRIIW